MIPMPSILKRFFYFQNDDWITTFLKINHLVVSWYNSEMIICRLLLWNEYMHVDLMYLFDQSSQLYTDHFQYQHWSQSKTERNVSEHHWLRFRWCRPKFRYKLTWLLIHMRNKSWRKVNNPKTEWIQTIYGILTIYMESAY